MESKFEGYLGSTALHEELEIIKNEKKDIRN